ncbi:Ganglioside GM2 activator, partial [Stegodyphus mimosarum]
MKVLLFYSFAAFTLWCLADAKFFEFTDCTKKDGIAEVSQFEVSPDPVDLLKNMTITSHLKILRDVPIDARLRTRYYKLRKVFGIDIDVPIPCLFGKFGSCTLRLCDYLKMFRDQAEPFYPEGVEYGCPVKAGDYGGDNVEVEIPDITAIGRYIARGRYRTELELVVNRKTEACYRILTELK